MSCPQRVREFLRDNPGATVNQLARELYYSRHTILTAVSVLRDVQGRWNGEHRRQYYVRAEETINGICDDAG